MAKKVVTKEVTVRVCDVCGEERGEGHCWHQCKTCGKELCTNHARAFYPAGRDYEDEFCLECFHELKPKIDALRKAWGEYGCAYVELRKLKEKVNPCPTTP